MTTQLKPPAMPWKPDQDITPQCAIEIWSGIGSVEPFCDRQQSPCSVLNASVVFQTFGAISSLIQPKIQGPSKGHAGATSFVGSQSATSVGTHQVWKSQVSIDKRYKQLLLERCGYFGLSCAMVAHRLSTVGGVRCSPQVFTHRCSVTPSQHFKVLKK